MSTSVGVDGSMNIAVGIYGEIERWDPFSSTIPAQLVEPLSRSVHSRNGRLDVVVVAQQSLRKRLPEERFSERWRNLQPYSVDAARLVGEGMKQAFLLAGADAVSLHLYDLGSEGLTYGGSIARQDPETGACVATGCIKPFDTPSVRAHLYARFQLLLTVREAEARNLGLSPSSEREKARYEWIVVARNDGRWLGPVKGPDSWPVGTVLVKACASWSGLNDKFGVVPRAHADAWLDTAADLQDASLRFNSVETLLLAISERDDMKVKQVTPDVFPVVDYYWWSNCYPMRYVHWFNSLKECIKSGATVCDASHVAIGLPQGVVEHSHHVLSSHAVALVARLSNGSSFSSSSSSSAVMLPKLNSRGALELGGAPRFTSPAHTGTGAGSPSHARGCPKCGCLPKGLCGVVNQALCPRMDRRVCPKEQEEKMALERKLETKRLAEAKAAQARAKNLLKKSSHSTFNGSISAPLAPVIIVDPLKPKALPKVQKKKKSKRGHSSRKSNPP